MLVMDQAFYFLFFSDIFDFSYGELLGSVLAQPIDVNYDFRYGHELGKFEQLVCCCLQICTFSFGAVQIAGDIGIYIMYLYGEESQGDNLEESQVFIYLLRDPEYMQA